MAKTEFHKRYWYLSELEKPLPSQLPPKAAGKYLTKQQQKANSFCLNDLVVINSIERTTLFLIENFFVENNIKKVKLFGFADNGDKIRKSIDVSFLKRPSKRQLYFFHKQPCSIFYTQYININK